MTTERELDDVDDYIGRTIAEIPPMTPDTLADIAAILRADPSDEAPD